MPEWLSSLWGRLKLYNSLRPGEHSFCSVCLVCGDPDVVSAGLCMGCRADLPRRIAPRLNRKIVGISYAFAAFHYAFPISNLIKATKFSADLCALAVLESCLVEASAAYVERADFIVPVPLSTIRFLHRGFNQSGELARALGAAARCHVRYDCVRRTQSGPAQSQLSAAARRHNVRQAFSIQADVTDAVIVLVDDVITTGATVGTIARRLRAAGAAEVTAIALAATPSRLLRID